MRSVPWLVLTWLVVSCKTAAPDAASVRDEGLIDVPQAEAAAAFLGEALNRLAAVPGGFFLNKGPGDQPHPRLLRSKVDVQAKTVRFDFTPYAGLLGSPDAAAKLSELMTFPLPEGLANPAAFSLDDRTAAEAFGNGLGKLYSTLDEDGFIGQWQDSNYEGVFEQCQEQSFKKDAKIYVANVAGGDTEIIFDCRKLKRQSGSKLTLTPFEAFMLLEYTGEFYKTSNRVTRARRFRFPQQDAAASPNARQIAIETFLSLTVVSALNKLDPGSEESWRGIGDKLRKSCEADAAQLPGAEPATPRAAAERFCSYYQVQKTFRECSFQSTSRLPNIALMFSRVLKNLGSEDNIGEDGPEYGDDALPTDGKVGIILHLKGTRGQYVAPFSPMVHEHEVLYQPSLPWKVAGAAVALKPKAAAAGAAFTSYEKFEVVACSALGTLTDDQASRISHLRLSIVE